MAFSLLACGRAQTAGEGLATTLPWLDRQADVLQVAPDLPVANVDDADRRLADLPGEARVGPFANNDYGLAFGHQPFDLKPYVRRARHRLAAQEDEGLPAKDRLGPAGWSMDDVGMQPAGKAIPVARAECVKGRRHDVRSRATRDGRHGAQTEERPPAPPRLRRLARRLRRRLSRDRSWGGAQATHSRSALRAPC